MKFVEKPNLKLAEQMLEAGNFLWNAGIFLFRARDMIDAFKVYAGETLELVSKSVHGAYADLGFYVLQQSLGLHFRISVLIMQSWRKRGI